MIQDEALREFYTLPQEAQHQVVDFIAFLQTRYEPSISKQGVERTASLAKEPFVGIWRNREGMSNTNA